MKKLFAFILAVLLLAACTRATTPTALPPVVQPTEKPTEPVATQPPQPPAAQVYLQATQIAMDDYLAAVKAIDAQVDMYEVNQQWIYDAGWKETTFGILDDLQAAADELHALPDAPPEPGRAGPPAPVDCRRDAPLYRGVYKRHQQSGREQH